MRKYECVLLQEENEEIQHSQHNLQVIGEDSKVHLRHRSGPLETREEATQYKIRKLRTRGRCARAT